MLDNLRGTEEDLGELLVNRRHRRRLPVPVVLQLLHRADTDSLLPPRLPVLPVEELSDVINIDCAMPGEYFSAGTGSELRRVHEALDEVNK